MKIKVFLERENQNKTIDFSGGTMEKLMEKLKINKAEVITVRNNELVTENEKIKTGDSIKFLAVISGG